MFTMGLTAVVTTMIAIKEEHKAFDLKCSLLPKEEADKLRLERKERIEKEAEHRKRLEIADAGRARNFWGN